MFSRGYAIARISRCCMCSANASLPSAQSKQRKKDDQPDDSPRPCIHQHWHCVHQHRRFSDVLPLPITREKKIGSESAQEKEGHSMVSVLAKPVCSWWRHNSRRDTGQACARETQVAKLHGTQNALANDSHEPWLLDAPNVEMISRSCSGWLPFSRFTLRGTQGVGARGVSAHIWAKQASRQSAVCLAHQDLPQPVPLVTAVTCFEVGRRAVRSALARVVACGQRQSRKQKHLRCCTSTGSVPSAV